MSKPIRDVQVTTLDDKTRQVKAVIDTGSFYTIIREDRLPSTTTLARRAVPRELRAAQGGKLRVTGDVSIVMLVEGKMIDDVAMVSPELAQEMLIGAGTMQKWDISVLHENGHTSVRVGRDMRDPEITEVD
ncbi:MAG: hypothetical protein HYT87_01315 [Nitrospirae bacterium]|nr:hypothetical protein [Nitrospirota bacterium]